MDQFEAKNLNNIAVLTSGGDAPGMNAALRAIVRTSIRNKLNIHGIYRGYAGLLDGDLQPFRISSVANIIQRGGTILKTSRLPSFHQKQVRKEAYEILKSKNIDALIAIGGDGTLQGAQLLSEENQFPVIGIPASIDNDIFGSDYSIGFDTAVNTAVEAVDKIRDTASSHNRLFIVEVMGRNTGFLAAHVGLACGAEEVFVPEDSLAVDTAIQHLEASLRRGKLSSIIVAAEGRKPGRAYDLAEAIRKKSGHEAKVCVLGHIQRGGSPTAQDRVLASRLGYAAVKALMDGVSNMMVGMQKNELYYVPLTDVVKNKKSMDPQLIPLIQGLSI